MDRKEDPVMTDPERSHTTEPAEGGNPPGEEPSGRTPHPEEPAEGGQVTPEGADTPDPH
jgi:hypothetical protein